MKTFHARFYFDNESNNFSLSHPVQWHNDESRVRSPMVEMFATPFTILEIQIQDTQILETQPNEYYMMNFNFKDHLRDDC